MHPFLIPPFIPKSLSLSLLTPKSSRPRESWRGRKEEEEEEEEERVKENHQTMPRSNSSSSSEDLSKKEPPNSSNPDHHSPTSSTTTTNQTNQPSGVFPTPPTMGYPPAMGYPPPHPNYPPNGHNQSYNPYTQPPPAAYYNPHHPYPPPSRGGSAFVRGFLSMLLILIIFTCVSSIVTWIILRPQIPVFHVDSFAVSGLNLSKTDFTATWDVNMTAENPNHKLKLYFDQIQSFVFYEENLLSSAAAIPMFLDTKKSDVMGLRLTTNNSVDHAVGNWVVEEIGQKKSSAAGVSFNLRIMVLATFKSGAWWARKASLKVFCEDLKVSFVGGVNSTTGAFQTGGNPRECEVYYG